MGVEHNIICLLKRQGFSEQEAIDKTGDLMDICQRDWSDALAKLPSWGEQVDQEVRRYIDVCRDVARANLNWRYVHMDVIMRSDSDLLTFLVASRVVDI
jgi:hypothetical protein